MLPLFHFAPRKGNRIDQFLLQPDQIVCRFDDDARKANLARGNVVIFEHSQFPVGDFLASQHIANSDIYFVEVCRMDISLKHRDVRSMRPRPKRSPSERL